MGEAGRRLSEIEAIEGAAGNMSVFFNWPVEPQPFFSRVLEIGLPVAAPELAGGWLLVTGSGRRLREVQDEPAANLGLVRVLEGGLKGQLFLSHLCQFERLTSELNSHLVVHRDQVRLHDANFHAVVHAQPPHLTYLSHLLRYQDPLYFNRHLLRWQPETIIQLPEGIGVLPFILPGTPALMQATAESLRKHRVVMWSKHGVIARSDVSIKRAVDRIDYAEAAARYEYMNLLNGEQSEGLTDAEVLAICAMYNVQQEYFTAENVNK